MQALNGTAGYLSVWSSISALGALRFTDSMPLIARLALIGLTGRDHLAIGGDQVEVELAGRALL
jgi:hypothetical protein